MTHQCNQCPENNPDNFYARSRTKCKKCYGDRVKSRYHNLSPEDKAKYQDGVRKWQQENIFQNRYLSARARASRKGIECTIDADVLKRLYEEQGGKCFYSGMDLGMKIDAKYVLSVDRINSKKGYTHDNVVLVCAIVNSMKNELGAKEFVDIISKLYHHMSYDK